MAHERKKEGERKDKRNERTREGTPKNKADSQSAKPQTSNIDTSKPKRKLN